MFEFIIGIILGIVIGFIWTTASIPKFISIRHENQKPIMYKDDMYMIIKRRQP